MTLAGKFWIKSCLQITVPVRYSEITLDNSAADYNQSALLKIALMLQRGQKTATVYTVHEFHGFSFARDGK